MSFGPVHRFSSTPQGNISNLLFIFERKILGSCRSGYSRDLKTRVKRVSITVVHNINIKIIKQRRNSEIQ